MMSSINIDSQATQQALLEWADSMLVFLPAGRDRNLRVSKPEHLFDGAYFSILLEILDQQYNPTRFQQSLEASTTEDGADKRRNLHIIHMGLMDFARRHCPKVEPLIKTVDFQALDGEPNRTGMFEILVIFVCAACFRDDDNKPYVKLVTGMNEKYQQAIFPILQEFDAKRQDASETDSDANLAVANEDAELAREAALVQLRREADEAKRQAANFRMRLDRIQDNYDDLLRKHEELQDERGQLQKQIESEAGNFERHRMQRQLKENETLIAQLENERNVLIEDKERLVKNNIKLEANARKAEKLIDENQELKSKNEELSKKANMADNLRKKLENLKNLESELKLLQNDRMDLAQAYQDVENANMKIDTLRREGEAYAARMQEYEIDIAGFRDQKILLAAQNNELRLHVAELEQRGQIDEAVVKDLQDKVMMLDPSAASNEQLTAHAASLEDELSGSSNAISMKNLEVQRLQAENAVLKSSIGTETEKGQLVQEMEDLRVSRQALQEKYNDIFERYTVGQKQLDALIQNMGKDGLVKAIQACYDLNPETKWLMSDYFRQEAYSNLRTQVLAEQGHAKLLERQLEGIKEQLADKDRALLEARGDCKALFVQFISEKKGADCVDDDDEVNAVEKSSQEALDELKHTDSMLAVSLRAELDAQRKKYKTLKDEWEALQKQLLTAFIDKDELRREAEHANRELQKAADGQTGLSTDSIKQAEKMEKLRTRYKQLQQQYEQSELKNRELEKTLKAVRSGSEAGAQKVQTDQIIKNLQRENAMITTAWYDLTSRLQSNHVVLQRRQDVPKSWINKQRHMVNATPRR